MPSASCSTSGLKSENTEDSIAFISFVRASDEKLFPRLKLALKAKMHAYSVTKYILN